MDCAITSKSPERMLEQVVNEEPVVKQQCLENNNETECQNPVKEKIQDELAEPQAECNENTGIENSCKSTPNSELSCEEQRDVLHAELKDSNSNESNKRDFEEQFNNQSTSVQDPEKADNNKTPIEKQCNGESNTSKQDSGNVGNVNNEDNQNQTSSQNIDQVSSTSTQLQLREKCKYGSQCYRLNTEHKAKFSHPGDTDYDIPDNRPECPYGILCYRKNPQHRLDYKHSRSKRKRTQIPGQTATLDDLSDFEDSMEESVDESEYEDSFIDDDDLDDDDDDFESDGFDEDSEKNDTSQDEDSQKKKKQSKKKKKVKKN